MCPFQHFIRDSNYKIPFTNDVVYLNGSMTTLNPHTTKLSYGHLYILDGISAWNLPSLHILYTEDTLSEFPLPLLLLSDGLSDVSRISRTNMFALVTVLEGLGVVRNIIDLLGFE